MLRFLTRPVKIGLASTAVLGGTAYGYQQWQIAHPPPETRPPVKGYKAFSKDFTGWNAFQYKVGQTYTLPKGQPSIYEPGFHFCQYPPDCNHFYPKDGKTRYAEVEAWDVIHGGGQSVAGKLRVVREIPKAEWATISGVFISDYIHGNTTRHMKDGKLHRDDGPAVIDDSIGTQTWYHTGEKHRTDGPSVINAFGSEWYKMGQRHRTDGPAIDYENTKEWWRDGVQYKEDGSRYE